MQAFNEKNIYFSRLFLAILLFQRSFRSFLKYRTIVLHFLFPSLVHHLPVHSFVHSFIRSFVHLFHPLIPLGHNDYLFFCIIIHLAFIYSSFPRPSRDHPERLCRVPIPLLLGPFHSYCTYIFFTWSILSIVSAAETFQIVYACVYNLYIHIVHKIADLTTKIKLFLLISIFFLPNKFAHIKYLLYLCSRKF